MGSYDGAEVCDIVGLFILAELKKLRVNANMGCYKDDGLAVSKALKQEIEAIKKKICKTYRKIGLEITINSNSKVVQFLDVELNLENSSYKQYLKPGDIPHN